MKSNYPKRSQPFCPGSPDIVFPQNFKHSRTGLSGYNRKWNCGQHHGWQYQMGHGGNKRTLLTGKQTVNQHETGNRLKKEEEGYPAGHRGPAKNPGEKNNQQQVPHQKIGME